MPTILGRFYARLQALVQTPQMNPTATFTVPLRYACVGCFITRCAEFIAQEACK